MLLGTECIKCKHKGEVVFPSAWIISEILSRFRWNWEVHVQYYSANLNLVYNGQLNTYSSRGLIGYDTV